MLHKLSSYDQTARFDLIDLMLVSILAQLFLASRSIADGPDIPWFTAGNQTRTICNSGQPCQQVYRCPPNGRVVFTHSHVLETIKTGQQSRYNHADYSGVTKGSQKYPHIFRAHDTDSDIQDAIVRKVSTLPALDSIHKWRTEENIVEYPLLLGRRQYWEPDENRPPGAYRILAQRDPVSPENWIFCAVIAHVNNGDGKPFNLCEEQLWGIPHHENLALGPREGNFAPSRDFVFHSYPFYDSF